MSVIDPPTHAAHATVTSGENVPGLQALQMLAPGSAKVFVTEPTLGPSSGFMYGLVPF